ncbi:MAG: phosphotransferase, partial [Pseudomonadota bacterium]
MERMQLLENWLKEQFPAEPFTLQPASADASFRRYFRVSFDDRTFVVMDAPPQHEDCTPFLQVAEILAAAGVHVPRILARNLEHGFLLLSDLGNTTFLQALQSQADLANQL